MTSDCPPDFKKIGKGIDYKCFHFHTDSEGKMIEANFSQAVRLCKGKNSTVVDPASPEEANKLSSMVAKRAEGNGGLWLKYQTKCGECMVRMTLIILLITSTVYIGPGVLHTKWSVLLKCPWFAS